MDDVNIFSELWGVVFSKIGLIAFMYILVFILVGLDLISGIRKAKQRKELVVSYGIRRTVDKLVKYYTLLLAFTVVDALQMGFVWSLCIERGSNLPILPFFTVIGALITGFIEVMSIFESSDKKMKGDYQQIAKLLTSIAKSENKADELFKFLEELESKDGNHNKDS